jgi:hypothetical protein
MSKVIWSVIYIIIGIGSVFMSLICIEQNDIIMMGVFLAIVFSSVFSLSELYIGD